MAHLDMSNKVGILALLRLLYQKLIDCEHAKTALLSLTKITNLNAKIF